MEMLVTVAIICVLAAITLPVSELAVKRSKETELRVALREIRDAIDAYKTASDEGRVVKNIDESGYPPSLSVLVDGVPDAKSPAGDTLYFLRRIPRDPFYPDPQTPPAKTWGLRSYRSPPHRPEPGKDVFDVYSLSADKALDGTAYAQW